MSGWIQHGTHTTPLMAMLLEHDRLREGQERRMVGRSHAESEVQSSCPTPAAPAETADAVGTRNPARAAALGRSTGSKKITTQSTRRRRNSMEMQLYVAYLGMKLRQERRQAEQERMLKCSSDASYDGDKPLQVAPVPRMRIRRLAAYDGA